MPLMTTFAGGSARGFGQRMGGTLQLFINGGVGIDLRALAITQGWDQSSPVEAIVTADVGAASTASPAMTIAGAFPGGVKLKINPGVYIAGAGGDSVLTANAYGNQGGNALSVSTAVAIDNQGVIGGGGGSGGSGSGSASGAGAGIPFGRPSANGGLQSGQTNATKTTGGTGTGGVAGGAIGQPGANSPGVQGVGGGGGLGGKGGIGNQCSGDSDPTDPGCRYLAASYTGGAAGAAVIGNSFITWTNVGTRYGTVN